tara:strand:- start:438 stop:1406 length:969 start_codon:yes stop_codon:yes gene_type:complete
MQTKTKGVVLISVLLIVLLLSSVAVIMGNNYLISLKRATYLEFQANSLNFFRNIESLSIKKIDQELRFNSKVHTKQNSLFINNFIFETVKGRIIGQIVDGSNCFNINSMVIRTESNFIPNNKTIEAFKKFMELKEVDNSLVDEAIDQIIDWIDLDSNPRAYGLEDYYYSGPLNTPKEYSGRRLFYSVDELKSLPAIRSIGWSIFNNSFCALPESNGLSININTLGLEHASLLSSLFLNLPLSDAEYIIANIPDEGISNKAELAILFPSYNLDSTNGAIIFSSKSFNLITSINYEGFNAKSISRIYYGNNNNSYIFSRIYNGI